jgi:rod shape-determining protein MreD
MTRILLRSLNAPALILLTLIGVAVQTSLFSFWFLKIFQPDMILLVVIWCALRRSFTEGGIITLIIGNIAEIHSGAPSGVFLITYMSAYLIVRGSERLFVIPDLSSFIFMTVGLTLYSGLVETLILKLLGVGQTHWNYSLLHAIPVALVNGVLSSWVFRWLEKFDAFTYKNLSGSEHREELTEELI